MVVFVKTWSCGAVRTSGSTKCGSGSRNCSPSASVQQSDQQTVRNSGVKKTSWRGEATRPTSSSSSWSPPPDTTEFSLTHSPIAFNSPISSSLPQQQHQVAQTLQPQPVVSPPQQAAPAASPSHSSVPTDLNTLTIAQLLELLKQKPATPVAPAPPTPAVVREPPQQTQQLPQPTIRTDRVITPLRELDPPQAQHHSPLAIDSPSVYFNSDQMRRHLATSLQIPGPQQVHQSSSHFQQDVPHSRTFTGYRATPPPVTVVMPTVNQGGRHSVPFQLPQSSRTGSPSIRRPPPGPAPEIAHAGRISSSSRLPTQLPTQVHQTNRIQPDIHHSDRSRISPSLHTVPFLNPSQVGD